MQYKTLYYIYIRDCLKLDIGDAHCLRYYNRRKCVCVRPKRYIGAFALHSDESA